MSSTEGDHNTWDRASSQVRKHIFFEENTYNQMAQKHSDGHVLWGDKWTLKNLKINTLYKRLGFSFNTWRIKLCLKCSDLLKEELWSIFWVVTKDWNSLPVKNRTEPTQRETWWQNLVPNLLKCLHSKAIMLLTLTWQLMQEIVGWCGKITLCQDLVGKKSSQQSPLFQLANFAFSST